MIDSRLDQKILDLFSYRYDWKEFREIQNKTIPPILDGKNLLLIAGTASGKTEAVMIPVLNELLKLGAGVRCLYFAPLKSLINDIAARLEIFFRPFGLYVGKWHGDLSPSSKKTSAKECSVLVTTPESVESILVGPQSSLLNELEFIVVDEVHAFIDSPRGAQLASLMERLGVLSQKDQQRIAMSATVGNPELLMEWLQGSSRRQSTIVREKKTSTRSITVLSEEEVSPPLYLLELMKSTESKVLIFSYTRKRAEEFAAAAKSLGVKIKVHHSSVSKSLRVQIEEEFKNTSDLRAVVATSTLEMGIDIGDVDRVIFLEVPSSTATFLQRAGRAGRKRGKSDITVFLEDPQSCYNLLGIFEMLSKKIVDPVRPTDFYPQLLAHQLVGLTRTRGVLLKEDLNYLKKAYPFTRLTGEDFKRVLEHLLKKDLLALENGRILSGHMSAEIFGSGKAKMDFVVLFPGTVEYTVLLAGEEMGKVHPGLINAITDESETASFVLGGRFYSVREVDRNKRIVHVVADKVGKLPGWFGSGAMVSKWFSRAVRSSLIEFKVPEGIDLSPRSRELLQRLIEKHGGTRSEIYLKSEKKGVIIFTFAGDLSNLFLSTCLKTVFGLKKTTTNWLSVIVPEEVDADELHEMLLSLSNMAETELKQILKLELLAKPVETRKLYDIFGDKLYDYAPEELVAEFVLDRLFDSSLLKELSKTVMD